MFRKLILFLLIFNFAEAQIKVKDLEHINVIRPAHYYVLIDTIGTNGTRICRDDSLFLANPHGGDSINGTAGNLALFNSSGKSVGNSILKQSSGNILQQSGSLNLGQGGITNGILKFYDVLGPTNYTQLSYNGINVMDSTDFIFKTNNKERFRILAKQGGIRGLSYPDGIGYIDMNNYELASNYGGLFLSDSVKSLNYEYINLNQASGLLLSSPIGVRAVSGNLSTGEGSLTTGGMTFYNSANTNYATFVSGKTTASYTDTIPKTDGTAGQALLNNGSGRLYWGSAGSGTISGLTTGYMPVATSSTSIGNSGFQLVNAGSNNKIIVPASGNYINYQNSGGAIVASAYGNIVLQPGTSGSGDVVLGLAGTATPGQTSVLNNLIVGDPTATFGNNGTIEMVGGGSFGQLFTITSPSTGTSWSWTLPTAQGGTGTYLQNNGSGVLSWATVSAGSGTVTSIATGNGITGGTITTSGTLGLSGATGDIGSFSGTNAYSAIAAVSTGYLLGSQGTLTQPAWLQAATLNTSLTTPLLIGGTGASSILTLESTSGSGTTDAILFKTGSQVYSGGVYSSGNVLLGYSAGSSITSGSTDNVGIGYQALNNVTSNGEETAVGYQALLNAQSSGNTATGYQALLHVASAGSNYTGFGYQAGFHITGGTNAGTCGGYQAGYNCTSCEVTAFGEEAGHAFVGTGGYSICAFGTQSLLNATGVENTAFGETAGRTITTGTYNTFFGDGAGFNAGQSATGSYMGSIGPNSWVTGSNMFSIGNNLGSGSGSFLVGINNPSPAYNLDVNGTFNVNGNLTAGNLTYTSSTSSFQFVDGSSDGLGLISSGPGVGFSGLGDINANGLNTQAWCNDGNSIFNVHNDIGSDGKITSGSLTSGSYQLNSMGGDIACGSVGKTYRLHKGSSGDMFGDATLSNGVATITISGLASTDRAFVQLTSPAGVLGFYKAVCTTNTLTITSIVGSTLLTNTSDTSTLTYHIIRPY